VIKEIFKRWAEEVDDQDIVKTFLAEVIDIRDSRAANENFICPVFVSQLWSITLSRFKFNGNLLVIQQVGPLKNDTKGTLSNLFAHSIVNTDHVRRGGRHGEFSSSSLDVCVEKESL
jgi:hypothetical protein